MDELKNRLLEDYKYRFELHAHSHPASPCSEFVSSEFVESFIDDEYDGVVLTNHLDPIKQKKLNLSNKEYIEYYLKDFYDIKEYAQNKLSVCFGVEIRFFENDNEYLIYGVSENEIEKFISYFDKGIDVFYKEIKNEKNIILQAHPYRHVNPYEDTICPINPQSVDGIEVFNFHAGANARIPMAAKYAHDHKMIVSGGVDFHHPWQRGHLAMRCKALPKDSYDIAELIKSQDFIFEIGGSIILP